MCVRLISAWVTFRVFTKYLRPCLHYVGSALFWYDTCVKPSQWVIFCLLFIGCWCDTRVIPKLCKRGLTLSFWYLFSQSKRRIPALHIMLLAAQTLLTQEPHMKVVYQMVHRNSFGLSCMEALLQLALQMKNSCSHLWVILEKSFIKRDLYQGSKECCLFKKPTILDEPWLIKIAMQRNYFIFAKNQFI